MTFLIGDFSPEQYNNFLNTSNDHNSSKHFYIQLANFRPLVILINRLAHFIMSRFSVYPNNFYMFQKFKSFEFKNITTPDQFQKVEEVYLRFQKCENINQQELGRIGKNLEELRSQRNKTQQEPERKNQPKIESKPENKQQPQKNEIETPQTDQIQQNSQKFFKQGNGEILDAKILSNKQSGTANNSPKTDSPPIDSPQQVIIKIDEQHSQSHKINDLKDEAHKQDNVNHSIVIELKDIPHASPIVAVQKPIEQEVQTSPIDNHEVAIQIGDLQQPEVVILVVQDESNRTFPDIKERNHESNKDDELNAGQNGNSDDNCPSEELEIKVVILEEENQTPPTDNHEVTIQINDLKQPEVNILVQNQDGNKDTFPDDTSERNDESNNDDLNSNQNGNSDDNCPSKELKIKVIISEEPKQNLNSEGINCQILDHNKQEEKPKASSLDSKGNNQVDSRPNNVVNNVSSEEDNVLNPNGLERVKLLSDQFAEEENNVLNLPSDPIQSKAPSENSQTRLPNIGSLEHNNNHVDDSLLSESVKFLLDGFENMDNPVDRDIKSQPKGLFEWAADIYNNADEFLKGRLNNLYNKISGNLLENENSENIEDETHEIIENLIIGRDVEQPSLFKQFYQNTIGYLIKESEEAKFITWKIERYEDLIKYAQKKIVDYINSPSGLNDNFEKLLEKSNQKDASGWLKQLSPILNFCKKTVQIDDNKRICSEYLAIVRNVYQEELLENLRRAASWAKSFPNEIGANHIDAICHEFFNLDLNERCQKILSDFVELGRMATKGKNLLSSQDHASSSLVQELYLTHKLIKAVPNDAKAPMIKQILNSARGHLNGFLFITPFDPSKQSNPMHVFFEKEVKINGNIHKIKDIAMGSPTIEIGDGKAEINPEFQGLLRDYKRKNKVHLYINNQNYIPTFRLLGDESVRCDTLHNLSKEFDKTLYVVTLSQNSDFYAQKGYKLTSLDFIQTKKEMIDQLLGKSHSVMNKFLPNVLKSQDDVLNFINKKLDDLKSGRDKFSDEKEREKFIQSFHEHLRSYIDQRLKSNPIEGKKELSYCVYDSTSRFKNELIAQMFDYDPKVSGNCIPDGLKNSLKGWSQTAIDAIHQTMFDNSKQLTVEEQKVFIRLFYQNLSTKTLIETKADSYNSSCKDRIDRGAATDAESYAYLAILANCINEPKIIEFFKMLVFARAIIVRKRTIIEERLHRLAETVDFMMNHRDNLVKLHDHLFPGVMVTIDHFKKVQVPVLELSDAG